MCVGIVRIGGGCLRQQVDGIAVVETVGRVVRLGGQFARSIVRGNGRRDEERDATNDWQRNTPREPRSARPQQFHSVNSVPAPVSTARRNTRSAVTTSSTAMPSDLNIVI